MRTLIVFTAAATLIAPHISSAAPLQYANLTEIRKDSVVFDVTGILDKGETNPRYLCDKGLLECSPFTTSTLPSYAAMLGADNFFFSDNRDRALAQFIDESGSKWRLYRLSDNRAEFMMDVPWPDPIRSALFAAGGRIMLIGGGYVGLFDENTGQIAYRHGKSIPNNRLSVSPNGRYLTYYVASPASGGTRQHALYDVITKKEYRTSARVNYWDLLSEETKLFDWAPDGTLFYVDDKNGYPTIYAADPAALRGTVLAGKQIITLPYSVSDFVPVSREEVYFSANRDNPLTWHLYRYNFRTKSLQKIGQNVSYGNFLRRFGANILFYEIRGNSKVPVLYDPATGNTKDAPLPIAARSATAPREAVKLGGIWGVLAKPDNYDPAKAYPLVVWLHGGPYRGTTAGWHPYLSYAGYDEMLEGLRKQGVVILKLDYRGSYGYGRKFAESITGSVGKGEVADVVGAVNVLKARMKIGEAHLMGNSYGGYLAPRVLVERPDLFRTATLINGVTDWQRLLGRIGNSIFNTQFRGAPGKSNAALFSQASIASRVSRLTADNRVLIAYGTDDETITNSESTLFYDQLLAAGKNASIVGYEGEGHTIDDRTALLDICNRTAAMVLGSGNCVIE